MTPLVLVTGANGHIGFRVLVFPLRGGYRVRAIVRNASKEQLIRESKSIKAVNPSSDTLEFAYVPDLLVDGAYDEVVQGVEIAVHIGGPIAHGTEDLATVDDVLYRPSVKGTMNMLYSCEKAPSVKRVVLTSSVLGLMTWGNWALEMPTPDTPVITEKSRVKPEDVQQPPYQMAWESYSKGKIESLNETEKWVRERTKYGKLHFDVVNVHPSIVIGPHELAYKKEELVSGVNFIAIMHVMGQQSDLPLPAATVHVDDCAEVFLKVVDREKVKTEADGLISVIPHSHSSKGIDWDDALRIVKEQYPELVKDGTLPCTGNQPSKPVYIDATWTEQFLGMKFQNYDAQIKSLFEQWLEVLKNDTSAMGSRIL